MTLTEAITSLTKPERDRLTWNFEQGRADFIAVPRSGGLYVGVHLIQVAMLTIVEQSGAWALARKRGQ